MSNFILNELFEQKAKVYQTRPVRAMKYEKGMETGFVVHFSNIPKKREDINMHEGMKFFDTETEALLCFFKQVCSFVIKSVHQLKTVLKTSQLCAIISP